MARRWLSTPVMKIIKEDLVSSISGGWFFDSSQPHFTNIIHLYSWIIFFISPLLAHLGRLSTPYMAPLLLTSSDDETGCEGRSVKDIEERCRRVGQAGLDVADMLDALNGFEVPPHPIPSLSVQSNFDAQTKQDNWLAVTRNTSTEPSYEMNENRQGDSNANNSACNAQDQVDDGTSDTVLEQSDEGKELMSSSWNKEQPFGHSYQLSATSDVTENVSNASTTQTVQTAIEINGRSPSPDPIRADMERCRLAIQSMKLDTNRTIGPPYPPCIRTTSLRDSHISKRNLDHRIQSNSQRHPGNIYDSLAVSRRRQNSALVFFPPTLHARQVFHHPTNSPVFGLDDAIQFWRQNFANSTNRIDSLRAVRSQSLRQRASQRVAVPTANHARPDRLGFNYNESRSHSFRQAGIHRTYGLRHPLRRPGSALRLRRQQSADCPIPNPSKKLGLTPPVRAISVDESGGPGCSIPSGSTQNHSSEVPTRQFQLPTNDSSSSVKPEAGSSDSYPIFPATRGSLNSEDFSSVALRRRLVRQRGFRRKTLPSIAISDGVTECVSTGEPSVHSPEQLQLSETEQSGNPRSETATRTSMLEEGNVCLPVEPASYYATPPEPSTSSHVANSATIDSLLAELMGVSNLRDAGLTPDQCLSQLQASAGRDDADNAELDILFAVTAAASAATNRRRNHSNQRSNLAETPDSIDSIQPGTSQDSRGPSSFMINASHPTFNFWSESSSAHRHSTGLEVPVDISGTDTSPPYPERLHSLLHKNLFRRCSPRVRKPETFLFEVHPIPGLPLSCTLSLNRVQLNLLFDRYGSDPLEVTGRGCQQCPTLSRNSKVLAIVANLAGYTIWEAILCILLAFLVSAIGFMLLRTGSFQKFGIVVCCFTIAGCHYSLVKSVQPDAASPQHGYNRVILFSRSVFFCLLAGIYVLITIYAPPQTSIEPTWDGPLLPLPAILTSQLNLIDTSRCFAAGQPLLRQFDKIPMIKDPTASLRSQPLLHRIGPRFGDIEPEMEQPVSLVVFGSLWSANRLSLISLSVIYYLLIVFPLLFPFGLVPQLNTTALFLLEQIDIHVFGGSGSVNLLSACFSITRNALVVCVGYWFCLKAISTGNPQHIWFAAFWSVHVPLCFVLSRLPSNLHLYIALLRVSISRPTRAGTRACLVGWFQRFSNLPCLSRWKTSKSADTRARSRARLAASSSRSIRRWPWSKTAAPSHSVNWWRSLLPLLSDADKKRAVQTQPPETTAEPQPNGDSSLVGKDESEEIEQQEAEYPLMHRHSRELDEPMLKDRRFPSCLSLPVNLTATGTSRPKQLTLENYADQLSMPDRVATDNGSYAAQSKSSSPTKQREKPSEPGTIDRVPSEPLDRLRSTLTTSESEPLSENVSRRQQSNPRGKHIEQSDPLPELMRAAMWARLENDFICSLVWAACVFGLYCSPLTNYVIQRPVVGRVLTWITIACGTLVHYIFPGLRKSYPWLCFVIPPIKAHPKGELTKWEGFLFWLCWVERNLLFPAVTLITMTSSVVILISKFGIYWTSLIIPVTTMKMLRHGFTAIAGRTFMFLSFTELFFTFDFHFASETFPLNYFLVSILLTKAIELSQKLHFVYVYTAPFRITWGSVTHAIVQIAFIPHVLFMLGNCFVSTLLSSPLEPLSACAVFVTSYARPIKFWEVNNRTERMETTNTALVAQMRGISEKQVDQQLNAIFYEGLTRSLQLTLAGDIQLGRLGRTGHGDVFILSSEDLNLVIHIIEVANGLVTFQLRGLEFMGTYCHEHETEALRSKSFENNRGCCCCSFSSPPNMLSLNAALRMRCMTWQFVHATYTVDGYRMTNHSADLVVKLNDLRRVLVNRFVQCIIYYVVSLPDLEQRLTALTQTLQANNFFSIAHYDLDPVFLKTTDEDFDEQLNGVTRRQFVQAYIDWIRYCLSRRLVKLPGISCEPESPLVTLCYALCLLGRRCMGGNQAANYNVDQVLRGIHDVFKGDVQVMSRDDWVLTDLDLLQSVVTPAMRIALKLYQDYIVWASECTNGSLYKNIAYTERNFVICHETDPKWRYAVLNEAQSLFSIRWVGAESDETYRFVQLTKSQLQFCVVKINSECVRGLWAGQQREQIFVRNTNLERGSIQGAQHVLRNLVNSSCDPPIGYPIFVSPMLTSFVGTHKQAVRVMGPELSFAGMLHAIQRAWQWICRFFRRGCRSKARETDPNDVRFELKTRRQPHSIKSGSRTGDVSGAVAWPAELDSMGISPRLGGGTGDFNLNASMPSLPDSLYSDRSHQGNTTPCCDCDHVKILSALVHEHRDTGSVVGAVGVSKWPQAVRGTRVKIIDPEQILNDRLNKLPWPVEEWHTKCLIKSACLSSVFSGLEGRCVHRWTPSNPDPTARSFCHQAIALVAFPGGPPLLEGHYVALWDDGGIIEISPSNSDDEDQALVNHAGPSYRPSPPLHRYGK